MTDPAKQQAPFLTINAIDYFLFIYVWFERRFYKESFAQSRKLASSPNRGCFEGTMTQFSAHTWFSFFFSVSLPSRSLHVCFCDFNPPRGCVHMYMCVAFPFPCVRTPQKDGEALESFFGKFFFGPLLRTDPTVGCSGRCHQRPPRFAGCNENQLSPNGY
jgi:hypothetical protein